MAAEQQPAEPRHTEPAHVNELPHDQNGGDEEEEWDEEDAEDGASLDSARLLEEIKDKPCRIHEIIIRGNERTREHVIKHELEAANVATTFQELNEGLEEARNGLLALGIFESVTIEADEGPDFGTADVYVTVKENAGHSASVGTFIQGEEHTVEAQGTLKNKLGHGETVDAQLAYGQEGSGNFSLGFHFPRIGGSRGHFSKRLEYFWRCWKRHSSHTQGVRGLSIGYHIGSHNMGNRLSWRNNKDSEKASPAIRRMLGHSLLSSVHYTYSVERRDSTMRPTRGYAFSATSEIAGLGPGSKFVQFVKQDVQAHVAVPLGLFNAALTGTVHGGLLLPWSAQGRPSLINDRFFIGGPDVLRGFRRRGIGPTDERAEGSGRDQLGGDILLAATAGLSFDLPSELLRRFGIHGHVFACAANLLPLSSAAGIRQAPREFAKEVSNSMRYSAGLGIVFPTMLGRLEVNYCFALRSQEYDRVTKRGIQVGFCVPAP